MKLIIHCCNTASHNDRKTCVMLTLGDEIQPGDTFHEYQCPKCHFKIHLFGLST